MNPRKDRHPKKKASVGSGNGRRRLLIGIGIAALVALGAGWAGGLFGAKAAAEVTVYKSPWCGCCGQWVEHLRNNGFDVTVRTVEDLDPVKARYGIGPALESCHTAVVGDYVVEGHVPAADIRRLLAERPAARGLAAPGMPGGAPGMESAERAPYTVFLFDRDGRTTVYARH